MILLLFLIALSALIVLYLFQLGYWKRRGIPSPPALPVFGNFFELTSHDNPKGLKLSEWTKKYGKIYGVLEGFRKILVVSDIDMLNEMFVRKFEYFYGRKNFILSGGDFDGEKRVHLFDSQGARWKRLRTISAPTFSANSLKKIMNTVEGSAFELTRLLEDHVDKDEINIHAFYQEYTMDIISQIAMGQIGSNYFNNLSVGVVNRIFAQKRTHPLILLAHLMPWFRWHLRKIFIAIGRYIGSPAVELFITIEKAVDARMQQREEDLRQGIEPGEPNDFIDLFLDARSDEVNDAQKDFTRSGISVSKELTRDEIIAQCFVFLLAGYDTTANALGYTSWLLAKNPEKQKKLQEEIDSVVGDQEHVSYEMLGKMKYAENVMKEALRLYPPAAFAASRMCMHSTTLGDVPIEEGTLVVADVYSIQTDKEIWGPDAEEFVPERWKSIQQRQQMAWMPFGAGPRLCIGQRLAYMEEKLALVNILRRFNIAQGPKTEKNLSLKGVSTVSPDSVTVYLKTRYSS